MGTGVLLGKALGRLIGIWRDSMLLCRPESLGYMRVSLGTLKPLISSRPWEKLAELILRMGAGLGVKQEGRGLPVAELVGCRSGTFEAWASLVDGRSRLLELTLSRLAREGGLTKLLAVALRGVGGSSANLVAGGWLAWFFGVLSGEPMLFREMLSESKATALALAFSFSLSV